MRMGININICVLTLYTKYLLHGVHNLLYIYCMAYIMYCTLHAPSPPYHCTPQLHAATASDIWTRYLHAITVRRNCTPPRHVATARGHSRRNCTPSLHAFTARGHCTVRHCTLSFHAPPLHAVSARAATARATTARAVTARGHCTRRHCTRRHCTRRCGAKTHSTHRSLFFPCTGLSLSLTDRHAGGTYRTYYHCTHSLCTLYSQTVKLKQCTCHWHFYSQTVKLKQCTEHCKLYCLPRVQLM